MATIGHTKAAPVAWTRAAKLAGFVLAVVCLGFGAFMVLGMATHAGSAGLDFTLYMDRTRDWLAGDGFYRDRQLHGPYPVEHGDATYPPVLLYLTVPFALGAPVFLWWAIPLTVLGVSLVKMRPPWWGWVLLALVAGLYYRAWELLLFGNPSMWAFAALAAGMVWRWPAAFVVLKLTLAPFALVGIRHRSWWIGLTVALVLGIPFWSMWADFATSILNAREAGDYGPVYLLGEWPIAIAIVFVGFVSRAARRAGSATAPSPRRQSAPASG